MPDYPNQSPDPVPTRDDLVARLDLIESMVAEGRSTTAHYGWIFVMWGLLYCLAMTWCAFVPAPYLAWPVAVAIGVLTHIVVRRRQQAAGVNLANPRVHAILSVWRAMGIGVSLFAFSCVFTHHIDSPIALSAIMFQVGLAHATSAFILRWAAQGIAAAVWWSGGIAALVFTTPIDLLAIFLLATVFGMVLFGLFVMLRERHRTAPPALPSHA